MELPNVYLGLAAALTLLVGLGCALGGAALWRGKPDNWPDVVASDAQVRRIARFLAPTGLVLLIAALGTAFQLRWAVYLAAAGQAWFVLGGFWGNKIVFGDYRPKHTLTNLLIALAVWVLIWLGLRPPS